MAKHIILQKGSHQVTVLEKVYKKSQDFYSRDGYFPIVDQDLPNWLKPETKPTEKEETTSKKSTKKVKKESSATENAQDETIELSQDSEK